MRSLSEGGPFTLLANVSVSGLFGYDGFYLDSAVTNGVTYYYQVKAIYDSGAGPFTMCQERNAGSVADSFRSR